MNSTPQGHTASAQILSALDGAMDYTLRPVEETADYRRDGAQSFSPFYSDAGLTFSDNAGIHALTFHYNRSCKTFGLPFLAIQAGAVSRHDSPLFVEQRCKTGALTVAFYARNSWIVEWSGNECAQFHPGAFQTEGAVWQRATPAGRSMVFQGYLKNKDRRDADRTVPFLAGVRIVKGQLDSNDGITAPLVFSPDNGRLLLAFSVTILDVELPSVLNLLDKAPDSAEKAVALSAQWLKRSCGELRFASDNERETELLARSALSLLFNSCEAPGMLQGRVASFPSRAIYPSHYLWDSCFHNLALEYMEPRLAEDALLLLTENMRADGKIAAFLNSTWPRPNESQPPLLGWAGLRLFRQRRSAEFAQALLHPLRANTEWWLANRMTGYGLISTPHPLETGWDDSPRFDQGPVLACDMNTHLLLQMRATAELANAVGEASLARSCSAQADRYAEQMLNVLYDPEDNLFREVLVETGEHLAIKTPACFLPLLGDLPIAAERAHGMIESYLLNPHLFFGDVPFPCVAYDEPTYEAHNWWRGPTWPSLAFLTLDVLRKFGYANEYSEARDRLYNLIIEGGRVSELFDSATGSGMGSAQQGWTAAIFIHWHLQKSMSGAAQ